MVDRSHRITFMISRTSSSISIFNEVPLVLRRLSLHEFLESCYCAFKIVDTMISYNYEPAGFWRRKFPPIISPTKEAFETDDYSYLFINSLLLFKPVKTRGSHFRNFCSMTKLEEKYNQTRYLPDHFGPRSWSSGRAQGSKSSSSWFPFHPALFPAFSPGSARYPSFSFCKKSLLEVKNVSNK